VVPRDRSRPFLGEDGFFIDRKKVGGMRNGLQRYVVNAANGVSDARKPSAT
jgi:hypothetical protein